MQITIRNIPASVDQALRMKAKLEGKTIEQTALEVINSSLKTDKTNLAPTNLNNLKSFSGSWIEDLKFDQIIQEQDRIDTEMWK